MWRIKTTGPLSIQIKNLHYKFNVSQPTKHCQIQSTTQKKSLQTITTRDKGLWKEITELVDVRIDWAKSDRPKPKSTVQNEDWCVFITPSKNEADRTTNDTPIVKDDETGLSREQSGTGPVLAPKTNTQDLENTIRPYRMKIWICRRSCQNLNVIQRWTTSDEAENRGCFTKSGKKKKKLFPASLSLTSLFSSDFLFIFFFSHWQHTLRAK